ncbi:MAG: hypothetical protein SGJ00_14860 [bacterium]|nr:hypothetical protein [bacterium]
MKRIFITLLIIVFFGKIYCQPYYSNLYDIYKGWESVYNVVEINDINKTILFNGDFFNPVDTINDSVKYVHVHNFVINFEGVLIRNFILEKKVQLCNRLAITKSK